MDYQEIIDKIKPELDKVIDFLNREVAKIQTARPSPSLVEGIIVEYYGEKRPLKEIATISVPGPRQLLIQPWDKSTILEVERALKNSGIGASPILEKDSIRLSFPPLSGEFRKDLLRILSEKLEQARITLRRWREEAWKEIQLGFREGKIREDDKFRAKDKLQELLDDYNQKIEEIGERKKREIIE